MEKKINLPSYRVIGFGKRSNENQRAWEFVPPLLRLKESWLLEGMYLENEQRNGFRSLSIC